jgi:hypothetical protein
VRKEEEGKREEGEEGIREEGGVEQKLISLDGQQDVDIAVNDEVVCPLLASLKLSPSLHFQHPSRGFFFCFRIIFAFVVC